MGKTTHPSGFGRKSGITQDLLDAFFSKVPAAGFTHGFYAYPARFSPQFARAAILSFTQPGDTVLDPFMGGGTTLVESLASGRHSIGSDINPLSKFLAESKTTLLTPAELSRLELWARTVIPALTLPAGELRMRSATLNSPPLHVPIRVSAQLAAIRERIGCIREPRQQRLALCALLRTAQWALDRTASFPSLSAIRDRYVTTITQYSSAVSSLRAQVASFPQSRRVSVVTLQRPAQSLSPRHWSRANCPLPMLVLTSPPYPQVHVLYNRWQIAGRRETPAPYWILGMPDGAHASAFTMGARSRIGLEHYFGSLEASFSNIRNLVSPKAIVVQLVAFADPHSQLPRYLAAMEASGFRQALVTDGRDPARTLPARRVPNRKWYANYKGATPSSTEFLLIHRPS